MRIDKNQGSKRKIKLPNRDREQEKHFVEIPAKKHPKLSLKSEQNTVKFSQSTSASRI